MRFFIPRAIYHLFLWISPLVLTGQSSTEVMIKDITIKGNQKTKAGIIFRECTFRIGDTIRIEDLDNAINQSRLNIINSGLFNDVQINVGHWDFDNQTINITIEVKETWYLFWMQRRRS